MLRAVAGTDVSREAILERMLARIAAGLIGEDDIEINRAWIRMEVETVLPNWRRLLPNSNVSR